MEGPHACACWCTMQPAPAESQEAVRLAAARWQAPGPSTALFLARLLLPNTPTPTHLKPPSLQECGCLTLGGSAGPAGDAAGGTAGVRGPEAGAGAAGAPCFLEVRASNAPAIALYTSLGFQVGLGGWVGGLLLWYEGS